VLCVLSWLFWGLLTAVLFTYLTRAVVVGRRTVPVARDDGSRAVATVGAFAREFVLAALTLASWPLGLVPIRIFSAEGRGTPIVLIPGALMTWTACLPLRWFLRARVDNPVVLLGYTPLWGSPVRAAERLGDRIRTLARLAPEGQVHLIAFGEGGLAALGAMAADPELPVARLVTIATPFVAPRMGRVFLPGGAERYPADPTDLPAPSRAIRSAGDNLVLPDESQPPEGTDTVTFASDGHLSTWYSPQAWQRALEALELEPPE
jgi:hypothetical protein